MMQNEYPQIRISDVSVYERNPRKNDKAVDAVARSIKEFGFRVPVVLGKDNVIIAGHTRIKAAKKIGLKEVPYVRADDLTEEQAKAFRLIENKTSEIAEWDDALLPNEIGDIAGIDLNDFGFDLDLDEGPSLSDIFGRAKDRGWMHKGTNFDLFDFRRVSGKYQMPTISKTAFVPDRLIGFNYICTATSKDVDAGVHFFIDDYQFERIWNRPMAYMDKLKNFQCAFTPDFSLYMDMPMALKVWNVYRSRLIGQIMQDNGIVVIPTIQWADPETYEFCFDGLEQGGVVAVSTVGVATSKKAQETWTSGMNECIKRLEPQKVLLYGSRIDYDFGDVEVVHYPARRFANHG